MVLERFVDLVVDSSIMLGKDSQMKRGAVPA